MGNQTTASDFHCPLFVDLDGTLIKSDLLFESFLALFKKSPLYVFLVPLWLIKGKAHLKSQIAMRVDIDPALLPYNSELVDYLRTKARSGHKLFLATASNEKYAKRISDYLGFFTGVLASTEDLNLSGKNKLKAIIDSQDRDCFDYAGNATIDLNIFQQARAVILINPEKGVESATAKVAQILYTVKEDRCITAALVRALRIHQWMKNILVFVPLLAAHQWFNAGLVGHGIVAFISFSLCASGMYILNDLLDLPADRSHPRKKLRPFASGMLHIKTGLLLSLALPLTGIVIAAGLSLSFMAVSLTYLLITLVYSLRLKSYVFVDVLTLASLYTMRIIAGAVAADIYLSFWLLAFSVFIFLSLALLKRCSELVRVVDKDAGSIVGRDYNTADTNILQSMGVSSGYLSVLVVAFYINSPETIANYSHPQALWMICPGLLYWLSRMWLKTGRSEMHDDPLIYSIRDRHSQFIALYILVIIVLAI